MFGLGKGRTVSYVDMHNSAVIKYRRCCRSFIWVGAINFVGLIVGTIQFYTLDYESIPTCYCFGISDFLFTLLSTTSIHIALFWAIVILFSLAVSAGAILLGVFSSYGKRTFLFSMLGCYLADWIFCFLTYFLLIDNITGLMISAGIHAVASFFLIMALYYYYKVINIEKRFKNVPTVAEAKKQQKEAQKEEKKETKEENKDEHQS